MAKNHWDDKSVSNFNAVGIIMKTALMRSMTAVFEQRNSFETFFKEGSTGKMDNPVTSADIEAQHQGLRVLSANFPNYGIVAEEHGVAIRSRTRGSKKFFLFDPLDGTRYYRAGKKRGVGSMLALVVGDDVDAAYVGDVFSGEIIGYRPMTREVYLVRKNGTPLRLAIEQSLPLHEQKLLVRENRWKESELTKRIRRGFRRMEVAGGSIGLSTARLWKGMSGAAILPPGDYTPWDLCPIVGISSRLGFVFLRYDGKRLSRFMPAATEKRLSMPHETLIVHRSRVQEVQRILRCH